MTEAVQLLIKYRADVIARDYYRNTPLHLAAVTGSYNILAQLVQAGADVNLKACFSWTAIDQASISHHQLAVEELRRLGLQSPT
jgi:ankyrin repeat protein